MLHKSRSKMIFAPTVPSDGPIFYNSFSESETASARHLNLNRRERQQDILILKQSLEGDSFSASQTRFQKLSASVLRSIPSRRRHADVDPKRRYVLRSDCSRQAVDKNFEFAFFFVSQSFNLSFLCEFCNVVNLQACDSRSSMAETCYTLEVAGFSMIGVETKYEISNPVLRNELIWTQQSILFHQT